MVLGRLFDIVFSSCILLLTSPLLLIALLAIYFSDFHSPFYFAPRVGKKGKIFTMMKMRTMIVDAEKSKVDSTSADDPRITKVGHLVRRFKVDELLQFINVVKGNMTIVGPRPNVEREAILFTEEEKRILLAKPGVTDLSSIVFSDLGEILYKAEDANLAYNQLVRPWKSRLCLFYIDNKHFMLDLRLIWLTIVVILSRKLALKGVVSLLKDYHADSQLIKIASREVPLKPTPPPGCKKVVTSRSV